MATGIFGLVERIGDLYLNEKDSDVTILVDGKTLPAHRLILKQRCPYFEHMFNTDMKESKTGQVVIKESTATTVETILKWIYTGIITFTDVNSDIEVLRLAHMYELAEVVAHVIRHLKSQCTVDNAVVLLNEAVLLSLDDLKEHVFNFWKKQPDALLDNETFLDFTPDALEIILATKTVSVIKLLTAFVQWMKANTVKKAKFPDLLNIIPLYPIPIEDLAQMIPSNLIDGNIVLDIVREQRALMEVDDGTNGAKAVKNEILCIDSDGVLRHMIGLSANGILIDLGRRFKLNLLKMHLVDTDDRTYSYWIAVSEDNVNWTRIDHSKYACRSLQRLYFKEQLIRYVRICGTAPANGVLEMSRLEAFYTTESFEIDPETTLLMPSENVALIEKNAIVIEGVDSKFEHGIINGIFHGAEYETGYTSHFIGEGEIIVQLPQPYIIGYMRLLLNNLNDRIYNYYVEVSTDKITWTRVSAEVFVTSWREIHFEKRPVVFIKLTGTYSSAGGDFTIFPCIHLECMASKKI